MHRAIGCRHQRYVGFTRGLAVETKCAVLPDQSLYAAGQHSQLSRNVSSC